jgi:hypothetical protein
MFPVAYLPENNVFSPAARPYMPVSTGFVKMGGGGVIKCNQYTA